MKKAAVITLVLILMLSVAVSARNFKYRGRSTNFDFSIKLGYFIPNGESDLWEYNKEIFFFEEEDLNSFQAGFAFNYHVNNFMTLTVEAGGSFGWTVTEYADYVDEFGYSIQTDIELGVFPVEVSVKLNPLGRGKKIGRFGAVKRHPIIPYIGAGVGVYLYNYREFGDYIDFANEEIVYAEFESFNAGVGYFVVAGFEIPMGNSFGFLAEYKYRWAEAPLTDDFVGFDDFDLSGQVFSIGMTFGY